MQIEDKPGSIALRAICSIWLSATMDSWAQLKGSSPPTVQEMAEEMRKAESEGEKQKEKKKKKDGTVRETREQRKRRMAPRQSGSSSRLRDPNHPDLFRQAGAILRNRPESLCRTCKVISERNVLIFEVNGDC